MPKRSVKFNARAFFENIKGVKCKKRLAGALKHIKKRIKEEGLSEDKVACRIFLEGRMKKKIIQMQVLENKIPGGNMKSEDNDCIHLGGECMCVSPVACERLGKQNCKRIVMTEVLTLGKSNQSAVPRHLSNVSVMA